MSDDEPGQTILEFATTDEIVDELLRRFHSVLVAVSGEFQGDPQDDGTTVYYRGGRMACLGLATYSKSKLVSDEEPAEDDEP